MEQQTIEYWKKNTIFEKSVAKNPKTKKWTFLDGPPFITGLPHYGTLLASIPKDVFPRFKTMQGYHVERVWGWDCHGLPAENKVETKLGITRKKDIEEKIGVKKFIDECKLYVADVSSEWEWYVDHIGRWVDFENAYKTMDTPYMESVLWVFKSMYEKDFIYKGLRVSLYCPHCSTPISNFEVAMDPDNYKEITEPANTYKYKVVGEEDTYFLAWSTTPWNKIATPALAVNPSLTYVKVKQGSEYYILAKTTLSKLTETPYEIVSEMKGTELVGKSFEAHYDYFKIDEGKRAFVIIPADFVTAEEGTGIVTIAAYGEEDLEVMKKEHIQIVMHVDEEGTIKDNVPQFGGMYYLKANKAVNEDLVKRGLMYKEESHTHTIPNCWRCHTRLFYAPQNAWYVDVQKLKPLMKETNEKVAWFPEHFKYGRFLKSMEAAPDWCISRSRYWGSPVPVWECECGERVVVGSLSEIEEKSGKRLTDLHKPEIDEVTFACEKCGKQMHRVSEVLDSWIEAGSASFAERHFPFNTEEKLEDFFPPDFIVEYTGQIRAWFYVLHVIGAALYKSPAFKNVSVTGVVLGTDGRKMSKNFGNYPDPKEMITKYGGDALRLYLLGGNVMKGEDMIISEEHYRNQLKTTLLTLWNVYNFFVTYALSDEWNPNMKLEVSKNVLDLWIRSKLTSYAKEVTQSLESFDTISYVESTRSFVDILSNWYIRRSRDRVGASAKNVQDKNDFYETCFYVLNTFCKLTAPLIPFTTEEMYRNLTGEPSVHLENWPVLDESEIQISMEISMQQIRDMAGIVHMERKAHNVPVRTPVRKFEYRGPTEISPEYVSILQEETNVEQFIYKGEASVFEAVSTDTAFSENNLNVQKGEARKLVRDIQSMRKELKTDLNQLVDVSLTDWPHEYEEFIKNEALVRNLTKGEFKVTPV